MTNEPRRVDRGADDLVAGAFVAGIGSPVSIDSSTADMPSTTTPSTGTLSPGRTRSRSPGRTIAARRPPRPRHGSAGRRRLQADEPADRPGRAALGAGLEPLPEQDQAQDDRRRVEVGLRVQAGRVDDLGHRRHEHGVAPRGARPDRHQGVHRGPAVPAGAPGGAIEAAAGPELDEGRRDQDQLVDVHHRHDGLRREHQDHEHERRADRDQRLEQRLALGALALQVLRRELQLQARSPGRSVGAGGGLRPDLVAGGLDGLDQLVAAGDGRVDADGRLLGREVDRGFLDARRLLRESARCD